MDLDVRSSPNNLTKANDLEIRNQFHTNVKNTYSRNNWSSANSSLVASTVRSQNDPSIYETAANSIDTSIIRNKLKSTASSVIYSGTNFNSVKDNHIISEHYSDPTRPLLSAQNSILTLKPTIWRTCDNGSSMMQGVDDNIYHWKVLNLSRAKLKASSRTSALLSGFAMVAMVEINIGEEIPTPLLVTFAVCTVLLIAVHMLALMISTCILPNVEAVANLHFQTQKTVFESPHTKMNFIIELAWGFSTVIGILLFLVEIAILCWVKFWFKDHTVAWVATGLLIPILVIFVGFAAHFYLKLVAHKSEVVSQDINELELIKQQLENSSPTDNLINGNNQTDSPVQTPTPGDHIV